MFIKRGLRLMCFMLVFVLAVQGWAQDETLSQQVELSDAYTIMIPEGWTAEAYDDLGGFTLQGDETLALVLSPSSVQAVESYDATAGLYEVLQTVFSDLGGNLGIGEVEWQNVGGSPSISYHFSEGEFPIDDEFAALEGLFIVIKLGTGEHWVFVYGVPDGELDTQSVIVQEIAATFSSNIALDPKTGLPFGTPVAIPTNTAGSNSGPNAQTASTDCVVSTRDANTVQLHVGPGYNRAVVTFLPANTDFEPTGSFTAADGSEWFQLDRSEAAPTSAASEVWVARENVDEAGDCDAVADASAPPIVPISSNPPPQATAVPGAPPNTPASSGGSVPTNGTWTLTFAPTSPVSCIDTDTVHINTSEMWDTTPYVQPIVVARDGNSFTYGGDLFTRISPTSFSGSSNLDDGSNLQMRLDVVSGTQMVGQVVINDTADDGTPCSGTTSVNVSRN